MFGYATFSQSPFATLGQAVYSVSVEEVASAIDSILAQLSAVGAVAETVLGSDASDSTVVYITSVAESSTGIDAVSDTITIAKSVSETASGSVVSDSDIAYPVEVDEFASASENGVVAVIRVGAVNEASEASDLIAATPLKAVLAQETISGSDAVTADYDFIGSISEVATASETFSSIGNLEATISETALAQANPIGNVIYNNLTIIESASAFDLLTQRKRWEVINTADEATWIVIRTRSS